MTALIGVTRRLDPPQIIDLSPSVAHVALSRGADSERCERRLDGSSPLVGCPEHPQGLLSPRAHQLIGFVAHWWLLRQKETRLARANRRIYARGRHTTPR